jgi:acyl carrier protein
MTTSDDVRTFVLTTIRDVLNLPVEDGVSDDTPLGDGGLDLESLSFIELTMHIESRFNVLIGDDEFERITVATLGEFSADIAARAA